MMQTPTVPSPTRTDEVLSLSLQLVAAVYAPPRDAFLTEVRDGTIAAAVEQLAVAVEVPAPALPTVHPDKIRAAHADLFVNSANAPTSPPYVGYAIDGQLLGPSAEAVGRFLASHGIGIDPDWPDLPDHVAAVAEAAAILAISGHADSARRVANEWLQPWFERYAAEVASRDASGLYGPLSTFLQATIREVSRGDRS